MYTFKTGEAKVKLSEDCNQALFTNGYEDYLLRDGVQKTYHALKDRQVHASLSEPDSFYIVACREYDR
jgi:hypothetical protein